MIRMLFYAIFATLCASAFAQNALPPIVVPKSGDVWTAGERQTVKWYAQFRCFLNEAW